MPDPVLVTLGDTEMNRCGCALELFLVQLGHRQENMIKTVWGKGCKGTHGGVVKEVFLEEVLGMRGRGLEDRAEGRY